MKLKRMISLAAALVLALGLTVSASAAVFSDMNGHWAAQYAEDLAAKGVVQGVGGDRFDPNGNVTAAQAFAFCARMLQLDTPTQRAMQSARIAEVTAMLPSSVNWAAPEVSICLEAGIVTQAELRSLCNSGNIAKALAKEDLAMFIARAMQLENAAKSATSYALGYVDSASISESRKVYVYLLGTYGVVEGNDKNEFRPRSAVTRAVMATMISRAMTAMATRRIIIDLPAYSQYEWVAGNVVSTSGSGSSLTLKLNSDVSGERTVAVPVNAPVYLDNVGSTLAEATAGRYAKVQLDSRGNAAAIYLTSNLTTYTGTVSALSEREITLLVNGTSRSFKLDRCTEVKAGGLTGTVSVIKPLEQYTGATVRAEGTGRAASLVLTGGSRTEEGLFSTVTTTASGVTLNLTNFDGTIKSYSLDSGVAVSVNGMAGTLNNNYAGYHTTLSINNDNGKVNAVAINTATVYVQGYIRTITSNKTVSNTISIVRFDNNYTENYTVADDVTVRYEGQPVRLNQLSANQLVTIQLNNRNQAISIDAYPGQANTEGTITGLVFDVTTTMTVTRDDGTAVTFRLDMNNLPSFTRDGKTSTVDRLTIGDRVTVIMRYNYVSQVATISQQAGASGTVVSISSDVNGTTLVVQLNTGEPVTYTVNAYVPVTKNNRSVGLSALQPGDAIDMVLSGGKLASIDITAASTSGSQMAGTVVYFNTVEQSIFLKQEDGTMVTVSVPTSARVLDTYGNSLLQQSVTAGSRVQIFGGYQGGVFTATLILKF